MLLVLLAIVYIRPSSSALISHVEINFVSLFFLSCLFMVINFCKCGGFLRSHLVCVASLKEVLFDKNQYTVRNLTFSVKKVKTPSVTNCFFFPMNGGHHPFRILIPKAANSKSKFTPFV